MAIQNFLSPNTISQLFEGSLYRILSILYGSIDEIVICIKVHIVQVSIILSRLSQRRFFSVHTYTDLPIFFQPLHFVCIVTYDTFTFFYFFLALLFFVVLCLKNSFSPFHKVFFPVVLLCWMNSIFACNLCLSLFTTQ